MTETLEKPEAPETISAWSPLKIALFRSLWIATVVSNIGTWAQEAGGPWLMRILGEGRENKALLVSLVAVAANLPICLLSIPAGALADLLDRRRLLIFTQIWMLVASGTLGILTFAGAVSPAVLFLFTFLLGVGTALSGPAFQAILPETVPSGQMPLAIGLNSVSLNLARAIGPALGMLVVWLAGAGVRGTGASFTLNAISFVGVTWVLLKWKRPPRHAVSNPEKLLEAVWSGLRYTYHSTAMHSILLRVAMFITCAVAMWAQLPVIARDQLQVKETGYAILMASLGVGAVIGVILMPKIQAAMSTDRMVELCTRCFAAGLLCMAFAPSAWMADLVMLFLGINWVIIPTNFNIATQRSVPAWVKGRALSMYLTTLFGSWAIGSAFWGWVTTHTSIRTSLMLASLGLALGLLVVKRFPLVHPVDTQEKP